MSFKYKIMPTDVSNSEALRVEVDAVKGGPLEREPGDSRHVAGNVEKALQMAAMGRLAGDVAHDFNNLLTIILGYSDVLKQSMGSDDPLLEFVQQIEDAGNRAAAMTRQLQAFSGKQLLSMSSVDLNELLSGIRSKLAGLVGDDIELVFLLADRLWPVRVDSGQMEQAIMNVIVNARDAMPDSGTLTLETRNVAMDTLPLGDQPNKRGDYVALRISDTGCGMDEATLARVFEPFFSTKPDLGAGLGLSMVYGLVSQSGGHIAVNSQPRRGTKFEIYLPRDVSHGG